MNEAAQDPIRLELGESANAKECGSCVHFERSGFWNGVASGYCIFVLPPQYAKKPNDPDGKPHDVVSDTNGCKMHTHTGKAYIVSRIVQP